MVSYINPIAEQLRRENLLPKAIGGSAEPTPEAVLAERREKWMSNFTPCPDMKERIQKLENILGAESKQARHPVKKTPNMVEKLVKTFNPQPGFSSVKTPRTMQTQKSMIQELTKTLESNLKASQIKKAAVKTTPSAVKTTPPAGTKPPPPAAAAPSNKVMVPKIAGVDYMGAPQTDITPQRPLGGRSVVRQRMEQLKLSGQKQKRRVSAASPVTLSPNGTAVKRELFEKGRRIQKQSEEALVVPASGAEKEAPRVAEVTVEETSIVPAREVAAPREVAPAAPTRELVAPQELAVPVAREEKCVEYRKEWTCLVRTASEYCSGAGEGELERWYEEWYQGRVDVWSRMFHLKRNLLEKLAECREHRETLLKLYRAICQPVETNIAGFDYTEWSRVSACACAELHELESVLTSKSEKWLEAITAISQELAAELVTINDHRASGKAVYDLAYQPAFQKRIHPLALQRVFEGEQWLLQQANLHHNSPTAQRWTQFLQRHHAHATLVQSDTHPQLTHFLIKTSTPS